MKRLILVALCGALGACSGDDHDDLKRWMAENTKDLRGSIPKLPEARDLRNSLLEKYPVESLKMIGYLNVNRRPIAVIHVEDKVKQVKVGDYVGLDFGMVTQITDKEVVMRELIQDSAGDWSERTSSLYLQGKEGSNK